MGKTVITITFTEDEHQKVDGFGMHVDYVTQNFGAGATCMKMAMLVTKCLKTTVDAAADVLGEEK